MKIAVLGLWHLGCVTAGCLASLGNQVIAYDQNEKVIANLQKLELPIAEPGLDDLFKQNVEAGRLKFTSNLQDISQAEILWVTIDTPVDDDDKADTHAVTRQLENAFPYLSDHAIVIISSQLPVGTTQQLEKAYAKQYPNKQVSFAYLPENLRLGKAIDVFLRPDRIVAGVRSETDKAHLEKLLHQISNNIVWMSVESAEVTKHALNAYLATSVVFINEIATVCEQVGASAKEVEFGLKSEARIGPSAYLRPGNAFAGGTLARDISYLMDITQKNKIPSRLFSAVLESNRIHKEWSQRKALEVLGEIKNKTIAMLGLTYKPGTNTLRRSSAIEACHFLHQNGARLVAYDPAITQLPDELQQMIQLKTSIKEAVADADAVIISTEWPEFKTINASDLTAWMREPVVIDAGGMLSNLLRTEKKVHYFSVGE